MTKGWTMSDGPKQLPKSCYPGMWPRSCRKKPLITVDLVKALDWSNISTSHRREDEHRVRTLGWVIALRQRRKRSEEAAWD